MDKKICIKCGKTVYNNMEYCPFCYNKMNNKKTKDETLDKKRKDNILVEEVMEVIKI